MRILGNHDGRRLAGGVAAAVFAGATIVPAAATAEETDNDRGETVRVATYNVALNRPAEGQLVTDLEGGEDQQARNVAAVIQEVRPDVVLLNEVDYDELGEDGGSRAVELFVQDYLGESQLGGEPIDYEYSFVAPVNTGVDSGLDLDNDGELGGPNDAYGFGDFPGQYGMAVLSRYPLAADEARTFQNFRWADMPDSLLPADFYGENTEALRLSSKSHWDLPVEAPGGRFHLLASHPTPPAFDGEEERNKRRNSDEIRLTADYVAGGERAAYLYDDEGVAGGLPEDKEFVVVGDQNSDPFDGGGDYPAIRQLLEVPRVQDPRPASRGAVEAAAAQPGNEHHAGPAELDTADFEEPDPGNLRVDYALPSTGLTVSGSGVFWPGEGERLAEIMDPQLTSDHHLVWVDLEVPAEGGAAPEEPAAPEDEAPAGDPQAGGGDAAGERPANSNPGDDSGSRNESAVKSPGGLASTGSPLLGALLVGAIAAAAGAGLAALCRRRG